LLSETLYVNLISSISHTLESPFDEWKIYVVEERIRRIQFLILKIPSGGSDGGGDDEGPFKAMNFL